MNRYPRMFAAGGAALVAAIAVGVGSAGAQFPGGTPPNIPPCNPGEMPTMVGGMPSCMPSSGGAGGPGMPPGMPMPGGSGGAGQMIPSNLPKCAPGQRPTPQAPCMMDMNLPECGPEGPPKLNPDGSLPEGAQPCRPNGAVQFNQAPPKESMNKLMTLDVDIDGEGEKPGDFDVTLNRIVKGIGKAAREKLQDQLEGESFIIGTNGGTKCFADKKTDDDAEADKVSCKVLTDKLDDSAVTIKATIQARMKFDTASFTPSFTATKVVIKGKNKI